MKYAIRYESRSTVNDKPVGTVYALSIDALSPGAWTYVDQPEVATLFASETEAVAVAQSKHWTNWEVVPVR
jgi:hypothetical protein